MADETLIYTILGEARGEGVEGMVAVANVIRNRADSGLYPSDPVDVVLQPWQFSTNNTEANGGNQAATRRDAPRGSALYRQAERIVELYIEAAEPPTDLTGGSLYYHVTGLNWRYASSVTTRWGTTTIGRHTFYPRQPLPKIDLGSVDLLQGLAAPAPMPRSARPGGYTVKRSQQIAALRYETRLQQRQAAIATEMRLALSSSAGFGSASTAALSVTPELPDANFRDPKDPILENMTAEEAKRLSHGVPMDVSSAQAREDVLIGGLGSLLGRSFPMGITVANRPVAPRPATVAESFGNQPAPGLRLPRTPYVPVVRPGDTVAESGLIRRTVQTVKIDPTTGMPFIAEVQTNEPAKLTAVPVGHGAPAARVKQAVATVQQQRANAPAWTSMGGSPFMTAEERVRFAQQYLPQTKAKTAGLSAPGAGLTPAQRAAISGSGAPIPRPADARPVVPPIPADRAPTRRASTGDATITYLPASTASLAQIMAPKNTTPKAPVQGLRLPVAPVIQSPIVKPATQTVTRTVIVRQSGEEVVVPRAGSTPMPADARPSTVPKPPVAGLRLPTAPKVSTATVAPQKPAAPPVAVLAAPGAGLTAAQRAAISGSGAPIPAVKPANLSKPAAAPTPVVSTKTVTVTKTVTTSKPSSSSSTPKPAAVQTVTGSTGKNTYVVGQTYTNGNGSYRANADGTFTRL